MPSPVKIMKSSKKTTKSPKKTHQQQSPARLNKASTRELRSLALLARFARLSDAKPSKAQLADYSKTLPKPSQNLPKTASKPSQDPPKSLPKSLQNRNFVEKLILPFWGLCWVPKCSPKPTQDPPKRGQNPWKIHENSMWKKNLFFRSAFLVFFPIFNLKIHWFFTDFWMLLAKNKKTRFCKNWAPASTGALFLRFRAFKNPLKIYKKSLQIWSRKI